LYAKEKQVNATSYDDIAQEYYDSKHITSRNFDAATLAFFTKWKCPIPKDGLVLDLGCGCGKINYYCGIANDRIIQFDISEKMLNLNPRERCKEKIHGDAMALKFQSNTFAGVVAFLFDPFNKPKVYREISRILLNRGIFIGTLPHHIWGKKLRKIRGYSIDRARLVKKDGKIFESDSFLMDDEKIENCLIKAQLNQIESHDLCLPKSEKKISKDILDPAEASGVSPHKLPIVKLIIARKS
jgi:ubiquinone/menaquinone biosynthesis C-methylase UbiE